MQRTIRLVAILAITASTMVLGGSHVVAAVTPSTTGGVAVTVDLDDLDDHCDTRGSMIYVTVTNTNSPMNLLAADRWVAVRFDDGDTARWRPAGAPVTFQHLAGGQNVTYSFVVYSGSVQGEIDVYVATAGNVAANRHAVANGPIDTVEVSVD